MNAQATTVDVSTNIFLTTDNGTPFFAGPNHTGVLTVRFENLVGTIPPGAIRVVVNLNSFVHYVSIAPGSPTSFAFESSDDPTYVTLLNTVPISPDDTPIDILINTIAISQTGENVILQADTEIANGAVIQETNTGNNLSTTNTTVGSSALPVTLAYFGVKAVNRHALLEWTTSSEKNNAFFEVQHSVNLKDFTVLGKVDGHGTTFETHKYQFTQEFPDPAVIHYYRLRQVDVDGKFEYSPVRSLTFDGYIGIELKLATNPVTNGNIRAYVDYGDENLSNQANVVLSDLMGRTVSKQAIQLQKGRNDVLFQGLSLRAGVYMISLQNTSLGQPKFVKVAVQ